MATPPTYSTPRSLTAALTASVQPDTNTHIRRWKPKIGLTGHAEHSIRFLPDPDGEWFLVRHYHWIHGRSLTCPIPNVPEARCPVCAPRAGAPPDTKRSYEIGANIVVMADGADGGGVYVWSFGHQIATLIQTAEANGLEFGTMQLTVKMHREGRTTMYTKSFVTRSPAMTLPTEEFPEFTTDVVRLTTLFPTFSYDQLATQLTDALRGSPAPPPRAFAPRAARRPSVAESARTVAPVRVRTPDEVEADEAFAAIGGYGD